MSKEPTLDLATFLSLFSLNGLYLIGYAFLFGMSLWVTFIGGVIAFRALPRQQFGNLQHRTFPIYFSLSIGISSGLLALWSVNHPTVLASPFRPYLADVSQAWALATVVLTQSVNDHIIGPLTSKTMFQRHKLEKEEGKAYNEQGVSDEMKALNRRFGMLHGWSSLANLTAFLALLFHGLWIANAGTGITKFWV